MATYYDILGVSPTSSHEDLKKSYHTLAREHHPDRNTDQPSTNLFHSIDQAWKVLSDETLRKKYDAQLKASESDTVHPVQEDVHLSDILYDEKMKQYEKDCRCGGSYVLSEEDVCDEELLVVDCDNCSLSIVVDCDVGNSVNKNTGS